MFGLAGHSGYADEFLLAKHIDQGRFTDIRVADDTDSGYIFVEIFQMLVFLMVNISFFFEDFEQRFAIGDLRGIQ